MKQGLPMNVAVIGCGQISNEYGNHLSLYRNHIALAGAFDRDRPRAEGFCQEFGGKAYGTLEDLLADPGIDLVINLTIHHAHYEVNRKALDAGKHVYTEKPMALSHSEARALADLARARGKRLGSAPATYLGEGVQTTARFLELGHLGPVRLVYAEVNWGQIERWIGSPAPYFSVGPLLDVGVYAITALTFLLGPVKKVQGYSTILKNPRQDSTGKDFPVTAPDFSTGIMEFESGIVARLTTNYYVNKAGQPHLVGFEFHGDKGSFAVSDYHDFNAQCRHIPYGETGREVPLLREAAMRIDRALSVADMVQAIWENKPHRCSAEHACHVIEIMEGLQKSSDEQKAVSIGSTFEKCPLMDWAKEVSAPAPLPAS